MATDIAIIPLTQGHCAIIDAADVERVCCYAWHSANGYARSDRYKHHWMHWLIAGIPRRGYVVDHVNGLRSDNRRCNLRIITFEDNLADAAAQAIHYGSLPIGVRANGKRFSAEYKGSYIGTFDTVEIAAKAHEIAKREREMGRELPRWVNYEVGTHIPHPSTFIVHSSENGSDGSGK